MGDGDGQGVGGVRLRGFGEFQQDALIFPQVRVFFDS